MIKRTLIIFFLATTLVKSQGEITSSPDTSTSFFTRKNLTIAALSGGLASALISSYIAWWKDNSRSFRFKSGDWVSEPGFYGIDKAGHFFTSYAFYKLQKELLIWGGYSEKFSSITSASLTFFFALAIEVGDAYSDYGFDYKDLTFNIGGLGYAFLQDHVDFLNNFKFKWSYIPKSKFQIPPKFSQNYDEHIYWLTFNVHNLFESSFGKIWPEYIQPAIGYSVEEKGTRSEFIIGLDFNLLPLFNKKNEDWNFIGKAVDLLHIPPAPGIKFSSTINPVYRFFILN